MDLTIAYVTARQKPEIHWVFDSLMRQTVKPHGIKFIIVDLLYKKRDLPSLNPRFVKHVPPKPNIWQGEHRITKQDWWAMSNARNTGICLCDTSWIAFLDDRCILAKTWLESIKSAMRHGYAVAGSYEKVHYLEVANGQVMKYKATDGKDCRVGANGPVKAPGEWWFGCTGALPLEWALEVNGYNEAMDSLSFEDVIFGKTLENRGYPIYYDKRMHIVEDRTPAELGTTPRRTDKGVSPNDKSHKALELFARLKRSPNEHDLRLVRQRVLAGGKFPSPDGRRTYRDWYDNMPVKEFI